MAPGSTSRPQALGEMQVVYKHTVITKTRGRSNYSLLPAVCGGLTLNGTAFGTLKFGHVRRGTMAACNRETSVYRSGLIQLAGGRRRLIGRRNAMLELDAVA